MLAACGCAGPPRPVANPVRIAPQEYRSVFDASVDVLRNFGFRVDRRDYRFGVITTQPLGSATVFEPWKSTNTTLRQSLQGTLNDEQRIVRIQFEPVRPESQDAGDDPLGRPRAYEVGVEVQVERHDLPVRYLTGSTDGFRIFGTLRSVPAELRRRGIRASSWRPVARDPHLEHRLLARILRRAVHRPPLRARPPTVETEAQTPDHQPRSTHQRPPPRPRPATRP